MASLGQNKAIAFRPTMNPTAKKEQSIMEKRTLENIKQENYQYLTQRNLLSQSIIIVAIALT
jgi:hypothetical protein